jgi:phosphate:Na+ symporter
MSPVNALIFGLGLFFLGLRLVSENLTRLTGGSLRNGIALTTRRPVRPIALGIASGALMQSATAVTFICVSMVAAGLVHQCCGEMRWER